MAKCFFVTDLHGRVHLYEKLFNEIVQQKPDAVFFGGDLLPGISSDYDDFLCDFLFPGLEKIKKTLKNEYPSIFIIMGNDDPRIHEETLKSNENLELYTYIHNKKAIFKDFAVYGYSFIPPTPFRLKDWERYDVSRYVDPGCYAPAEGVHSVKPGEDIEYITIQDHLLKLTQEMVPEKSIFLFHSPPYQTKLDRAALDGMMVEHVPLDVHVGSIAIKRFIEEKQPLITMHGHIHESSSITGEWKEIIGRTHMFSAAYDKNKLSLVIFDPHKPENNKRELI
ncbi:MAG: hypothetical protein A2W91_12035 [Bacteroidetes bacterium GWF2_38_335]|nr:MAG: hypothetical protein A2W91_12035 [Bacteroidetes bacterium GWF2_38_335]OFY76902.1 MAG: hypothetical protein A2281_00150 [Bacteroidetes bacterium RIFOXYA12_FULL_38_20]HBS86751.1 hypothetical protein [Bacteroidales bacterium]